MIDSFGRPPNSVAGDASSGRSSTATRDTGIIPAGERRVISVLFCDVVGSTALAGRLDPEEWAEAMNEAFRYMIAPIEEYGGMVARLMGDAVLAFFGAPQAHEDDPQRAILAGLGIVNGIRPFIRQFEQDYGLSFNVRVGINTGPVVVGEMGTGASGEYTAMGDAINLAARMEQTAAPGTVQISEDTYRHVAPLFDVWDLGGIEVKGKDEPVQAYRVLGVEAQPGRLRGLEGIHAPLVGRNREITRLRGLLTGLRQGQSGICYLIGEAGLGKSRLIAELRQAWRDELVTTYGDSNSLWRGWTEFVAVSYGAGRPYDMLKRQVRNFCGIRETDPQAVVHERLEALISAYPAALHDRMLRVFGTLLGDPREAGPANGETFQRELRDVLGLMTQAQTAQGPVVYVIDDVHWADVASLEAMRELLPQVTQRPVLFLFAMRPDWSAPGWQLYLEAQTQYPEYCVSIYLEPLSAGDSRALIGELLGAAGAPERVYELIERKAEGNPFFVEETVRTLLDSGALRREDGGLRWDSTASLDRVVDLIGLPGNVQALLTARIDQLEPDVRRTLQQAAVIGRAFPLRVLERIADRAAALPEHLKRLAQADLVRPTGSGDSAEYTFRHALTRDAAFETILLRQRRRYHRRVGEAMEIVYADRLADEASRLANHFAEGRDWPKAIRYHMMAGEAAARLYANSEALDHYTRALDMARANPTALDESTLAMLYRRLGRVHEVSGRQDEAMRVYEELERLGRERASATLELEAAIPRALLHLTPTVYEDAERGLALTERILTLAEQTGRPDAEAYGRWTMLLLLLNVTPDPQRAVVEGERALELARAHGLVELEAFVLNDIGRAYAVAGRVEDAFATFAQAYDHWKTLGNEPMMADVLSVWAHGLLLRGDLAGGERLAREGLGIGRRIGNRWSQVFSSYVLGFTLLETGRVGEALRLLWLQVDDGELGGMRGLSAPVANLLRWTQASFGLPHRHRDRLLGVMVATGAATHLPVSWQLWQAIDHHLAGDFAGAFSLLRMDEVRSLGRDGLEAVIDATMMAEIALAAGQSEPALALIERLMATMERDGFRAMWADILRLRGNALHALGRTDEAMDAYRAALEEAGRQGARRAEWMTLATLAGLEPDSDRAASYRRRAAAAAEFLAGHMDDPEMRAAFLSRSTAQRPDSED